MGRLEKLDKIMENEQNAQTLLDVIVADYGIEDTLDCMFYCLNEIEQERFLDMAIQKVGA